MTVICSDKTQEKKHCCFKAGDRAAAWETHKTKCRGIGNQHSEPWKTAGVKCSLPHQMQQGCVKKNANSKHNTHNFFLAWTLLSRLSILTRKWLFSISWSGSVLDFFSGIDVLVKKSETANVDFDIKTHRYLKKGHTLLTTWAPLEFSTFKSDY